jgi:hypothetical protein
MTQNFESDINVPLKHIVKEAFRTNENCVHFEHFCSTYLHMPYISYLAL